VGEEAGNHTTVGVFPPRAHAARKGLFGALERMLPVHFEPRTEGEWRGLDAAVVLDDIVDSTLPVPTFAAAKVPRSGSSGRVRLGDSPALDRRLRGVDIAEEGIGSFAPLAPADDEQVVAASDDGPVWVAGRRGARVTVAPGELGTHETLGDRLRAGRFLGMLSLVHFLRDVSAEHAWTPPPLRASFVVDDPNLHWTSYGYLRYPELVAHADRHGYHVAFATVPLDGWFAHPAAARLLRARRDRLSLLVHGNDHIGRELAAERPEPVAVLAQALRRVGRFEARSHVEIDRVMAPPHGACSSETMRAMALTGFEALCRRPPQPGVETPLAGALPADVHPSGLPALPRAKFGHDRGELALAAFLDRPLVLYGHHGDFADGLDRFAEEAAAINRLGEVEWVPLGRIARSSFLTRRAGARLEVRLFARRASIDVPEGVDELVVELPPGHAEPERETVATARFADGRATVAVRGGGMIQLALERVDAVDVSTVPSPPWRPWPLVRRALTEGRDRIQPLARRGRVTARS